MIERLSNTSGDVRSLLGIPGSQETIDLSDLEWGSPVVIRRVNFDHVLVAKADVAALLVECEINNCQMSDLQSRSGLIGAGNSWTRCQIINCKFTAMMSPQNRFKQCVFENMRVDGWTLCQTLFEECRFENCTITGMSAINVSDAALQIPEIVSAGARAKFSKCSFNSATFRACKFEQVSFKNCDAADTVFEQCDLRNAICNTPWLRRIASGDPFVAFLDALVSAIRDRLGTNSVCLKRLMQYRQKYINGETTSQDYSACLFEGEVPDDELDELDDIFESLEATYLGG